MNVMFEGLARTGLQAPAYKLIESYTSLSKTVAIDIYFTILKSLLKFVCKITNGIKSQKYLVDNKSVL
jgi:hypothetical protein